MSELKTQRISKWELTQKGSVGAQDSRKEVFPVWVLTKKDEPKQNGAPKKNQTQMEVSKGITRSTTKETESFHNCRALYPDTRDILLAGPGDTPIQSKSPARDKKLSDSVWISETRGGREASTW